MASTFLSRRTTIINISKASLKYKPSYVCFSTAYQRTRVQGGNEEPVDGSGVYEENTRFWAADLVAESAKGVRKATEIADNIADTAKKTVDGAWETSKQINHKVKESVSDDNNCHDYNNKEEDPSLVGEVQKLEGPVDTVEYRNYMERGIEELRRADK